jgi:hypothetical protein
MTIGHYRPSVGTDWTPVRIPVHRRRGIVARGSHAGARLRTSDHQSVGRFSAKATMSGGRALSGQLRPVKGVLSISLGANRRHRQPLIVPIAQKISLVRTRSQCDTGVIQDEFIRRYSMTLERGVFVCGEGVSPSIFRMKGPFDFILSREGLRERSNPLIPQEQRP